MEIHHSTKFYIGDKVFYPQFVLTKCDKCAESFSLDCPKCGGTFMYISKYVPESGTINAIELNISDVKTSLYYYVNGMEHNESELFSTEEDCQKQCEIDYQDYLKSL